VIHKADIFHRPVSFSTKNIASENPQEALAASLNKHAKVELAYMSQVSGLPTDVLKKGLKDHIYFNPIDGDYQIAERWIAGNVIDKANFVRDYLKNQPENTEVKDSLQALEKAPPQPIAFEELDFNLGERWIAASTYGRFASQLFDTDVNIHYSETLDDFNISCARKNVHILDKFAIKCYKLMVLSSNPLLRRWALS